jgi:hypothetical protein
MRSGVKSPPPEDRAIAYGVRHAVVFFPREGEVPAEGGGWGRTHAVAAALLIKRGSNHLACTPPPPRFARHLPLAGEEHKP